MKDILYMGHLGNRSYGDEIGIVKFREYINKWNKNQKNKINLNFINIKAGDKINTSSNIFYLLGCGTCLSNLSRFYADQLLIDLQKAGRNYGILGAGVYFEEKRIQKKVLHVKSQKTLSETKKYIENAKFIAVRSNKCKEYFQQVTDRKDIDVMNDVGMAVDWKKKTYNGLQDKPTVGINLAGHSMGSLGAMFVDEHVYNVIFKFVDQNREKYNFLYIPFNRKDDINFRKRMIQKKIHYVQWGTPPVIAGYIQNCDFFVGIRVHSDITSAAYGIPFFSITYTHPNKNFLEHIGYNKHFEMVNNIDKNYNLTEKFEKLVEEKDDIKQHLIIERDKARQIYEDTANRLCKRITSL